MAAVAALAACPAAVIAVVVVVLVSASSHSHSSAEPKASGWHFSGTGRARERCWMHANEIGVRFGLALVNCTTLTDPKSIRPGTHTYTHWQGECKVRSAHAPAQLITFRARRRFDMFVCVRVRDR